ncbi:MAG: DUF2796 domain-containing protein [Pseudomonadota bacterium]
MKPTIPLTLILIAMSAQAEDTRQLDAHEHGVGELNIAVEGKTVMMELRAPGADIVGFEYEATSDSDLAAVDAALTTLGDPMSLFVLPAAAGCEATDARVMLEAETSHDDHDKHEENGHDHGHADHEEHGDDHADHDHEANAAGERHSEFHAEYTVTCANPAAATEIAFDYFTAFPNAQELEVQMVTYFGAFGFEVMHDDPTVNLMALLQR